MEFDDISPELRAEALGKSPEELVQLAKENGVEIPPELLEQVAAGGWLPSPALETGCPDCGSKDIRVSSIGQTMLYTCNKCGKKWM